MAMLSRRSFLLQSSGLALTTGIASAQATAAGQPEPIQELSRGGMVYRRLGHTDLFVSLLSFGSHTNPDFRQRAKHGHQLNEEGQALRDRRIARALDLGVNMVDTYEDSGQWQPMARLVRSRRDKVLVSICRQFPNFVGRNIEAAARLFGHVDLYRIYVGDGPSVTERTLEDWDVMRKAKQAGTVRAIGIATHSERMMLSALEELEGMDYVMFPYNFIHARANYSQFLPVAVKQGVGLIAIKPLAAGSIVKLDPQAPPGSKAETEKMQLYVQRSRGILPAVVAELTRSLNRLPDETLCQAAMRFVYAQPFIACAMPGMFQDHELTQNYAALQKHRELSADECSALEAARTLSQARGRGWLPPHYRWLDEQWHV